MDDNKGTINRSKMMFSKNEDAERIVGLRELPFGTMILNSPAEEGYHCPVCEYESVVNGDFDERLYWSEYNGFLYCSVCNRDYPTCLCTKDMDKAISIYLIAIKQAIKYDRA